MPHNYVKLLEFFDYQTDMKICFYATACVTKYFNPDNHIFCFKVGKSYNLTLLKFLFCVLRV